MKLFYENLNEKDRELQRQYELFGKLRTEYGRQHINLLERDETIRFLKIQIEQCEKSKETLVEKYQKQLSQFQNDLEQPKLLLINAKENQNEMYSLKLKQQNELNDLVHGKIDGNK